MLIKCKLLAKPSDQSLDQDELHTHVDQIPLRKQYEIALFFAFLVLPKSQSRFLYIA